ncbi:MAG: hypothetical protein ACRDTV_15380 [Mycobacterium sp.]
MPNEGGDYSQIADAQLDALEAGPNAALYNAVLDSCELILHHPGQAHALSSAVTTTAGIRMRLPVIGFPPYKVFWSTAGPRIEAIFPHP